MSVCVVLGLRFSGNPLKWRASANYCSECGRNRRCDQPSPVIHDQRRHSRPTLFNTDSPGGVYRGGATHVFFKTDHPRELEWQTHPFPFPQHLKGSPQGRIHPGTPQFCVPGVLHIGTDPRGSAAQDLMTRKDNNTSSILSQKSFFILKMSKFSKLSSASSLTESRVCFCSYQHRLPAGVSIQNTITHHAANTRTTKGAK